MPKEEIIRSRVPVKLKEKLGEIAERRLSTESQIIRDALLEYLERHEAPGDTLPFTPMNSPKGPNGPNSDQPPRQPKDVKTKRVDGPKKPTSS